MWRSSLALLVLCAGIAIAREADGRLGMIRTPNNGVPAIVVPGGTFEAVLDGEAELLLAGPDQAAAITAAYTPLSGGRALAACKVPDTLTPGSYALVAELGDRRDENARAVFVVSSMAENYVIAHVTDTHIGSNRHPRAADLIFAEVVAEVNASDAAFAVITGDLTEGGRVEEFQRFLEVLDTCTKPTFVIAGNHDRYQLNYEAYFGPLTYRFRYGPDGYLAYDTKDFVTADELGSQDGMLYRYRRELAGVRWAVGLTHRFEAGQGMRSQITLFVDDPLDFLLSGHTHRPDTGTLPWGKTPYVITPAGVDGFMRMILVSERDIKPLEPRRPGNIGAPEKKR